VTETQVLAVANQKGGVAKTTTVAALVEDIVNTIAITAVQAQGTHDR